MVPVLGGSRADTAFSPREREEIERAIRNASRMSGLSFSVFVGACEGPPRAYATRRHAELGAAAADSVLILVDPAARVLEVVTGSRAKRWLDDRSCALATLTMTSAFAAGNLSGGIAQGLLALAEHGRHPASMHTGEHG